MKLEDMLYDMGDRLRILRGDMNHGYALNVFSKDMTLRGGHLKDATFMVDKYKEKIQQLSAELLQLSKELVYWEKRKTICEISMMHGGEGEE